MQFTGFPFICPPFSAVFAAAVTTNQLAAQQIFLNLFMSYECLLINSFLLLHQIEVLVADDTRAAIFDYEPFTLISVFAAAFTVYIFFSVSVENILPCVLWIVKHTGDSCMGKIYAALGFYAFGD
jgi:hypothetical protein